MIKLRILTLLSLLPIFSFSQQKWEGGILVGYTTYVGDLTGPAFSLMDSKVGFGLVIRNHISQDFGLRLNLIYGNLSGDDNNYDEHRGRNASFESPLFETSLVGEYEFLNQQRFDEKGNSKKAVSPYIYAGIGFASTDPDVDYGKLKGEEGGYSKTHLLIPVGGGVKFDLTEMANFGIEFGGRFTFTDYLDGISKLANPAKNDYYFVGGVTLGFLLN